MQARGAIDPPSVVIGVPGGGAALESVLGVVSRSPVYVPLDATLRTVATVLAEESIGAVLVRDPHAPVGIVSERDVVAALAEGVDPDRERARDVMTPDLASVASTESILAAADRMLAHEIRHLVLTRGEVAVGLVSIRDLLAVLTDEHRATTVTGSASS